MSDVVELDAVEENEEFGLDDLIEAESVEAANQAQAENEPSVDELERARAFAEKLNGGFLWGVDRFVCPSANIDELIDREAGTEALTPLALEMGGTMPPWLAEALKKYDPYIKAGTYMGVTIWTAQQIEKQIQAANEEQKPERPGETINGEE
ncbi:hypothetical protein [Alkalimarinus coralli]|uniref:hypothetical protein n=1 Tax=Alkalimarinus coralli TaxID=2935863 RepID=UPI00202AED6A|nr:hypothetical protein [Alkalimarinus coralli]